MDENAIRNRWFIAAGAALIALLVVELTLRMAASGFPPAAALDDWMRGILRIALIVIALLNLLQPYLVRDRFRAQAARFRLPGDAAMQVFLLGVIYCLGPLLYGVFLFVLGDPAQHVLYGALASIIAVIVWTAYVIRSGSGRGREAS